MVAPMVLAAGIGAAGSALGGVMGGKGAKKAAKVAAKSQQKVTAMNNALVQGMYNSNAARLDPYIQGGTRAGNVLMELLLGPAQGAGGGAGGGYGGSTANPGVSQWNTIQGYLTDDIDQNFDPAAISFIQQNMTHLPQGYAGPTLEQIQRMPDRQAEAALAQLGGAIAGNLPSAAPGATGANGQPTSALSAWDQFRNSTNYNWRFGQGQEATAQNFAGSALDSGAQRLAEIEYGQQFASNELGNWMNMLAGQQGIGLQAGGALAGVGMNATNAQMANNQNAANAQSNAALMAGQANQNMWGSIGQGIGQIAGAWGSSYGPNQAGAGYMMPTAATHGSPILTSYQNPAYRGGSTWGG